MKFTRQACVLGKVDAFSAKESASLVVRKATHQAIFFFTARALKVASERLNQQPAAVEQVRLLCILLRPNQPAEEQEGKILEPLELHQEVYHCQRIPREVCNRGRPVFHRDIER